MGRLSNSNVSSVVFKDVLGQTLSKGDMVLVSDTTPYRLLNKQRVAKIDAGGVRLCNVNAPAKAMGNRYDTNRIVKINTIINYTP